MSIQKKMFICLISVLLLIWLSFNFARFSSDTDTITRVLMGILFCSLIIFRQKWIVPDSEDDEQDRDESASATHQQNRWILPVTGISGTILALTGIIFRIHQLEWLGIIIILYASLRWIMPAKYSRDILFSIFLLYWIHPLPAHIMGPFQLFMQRLSVSGSEFVLHCANVRVWADGFILRTIDNTFEVPTACSGMRTAVTVLLCCIGAGTLFRYRWYELIILIFAGLTQVLILNIVRISFMIAMAEKLPEKWSLNFLHDTAGFFLLAAIFLIQLEASIWAAFRVKRIRKKTEQERGKLEPADKASMYHPFWNMLFKLKFFVPIIVLAVISAVPIAYRSRPYHRAMMISDVVNALAFTDLECAEKGSLAALALVPDDYELQFQRVKILLLRKKFEDALMQLAVIAPEGRLVLHTILKTWAMMGLNRIDESIALLDNMPEYSRRLPGVAIVRAELAAANDDVKGVIKYITRASDSPWMLRRARDLFPYLAARQQWQTIIDCDSSAVPYEYTTDILIVIHAYMKTDRLWSMGKLLEYGIEKWPEDPRFMEYLGSMAMNQPDSKWEKLLAEKLKLNLYAFHPDELSVYIENCFRMSRPDMAWLLYNRLAELDPNDPSLYMAPAQFSDIWFEFRKHHAGIPSAGKYDKIDLKSFYSISRSWPTAPLTEEMAESSLNWTKKRHDYLQTCLREFEQRDKKGHLTSRTRKLYQQALQIAGRHDDADAQLGEIRKMQADNAEMYMVINAINARMQSGNIQTTWELLDKAMTKWPHEPGFTECLGELAVRMPGTGFEEIFRTRLESELLTLSTDELSIYIENCFRINRPDLAWLSYNQLAEIDPSHPALYLTPLQFGPAWFVFRKNKAGIPFHNEAENVDLKILCAQSMNWPVVPLAEELINNNSESLSSQYLQMCLEELKRREQTQSLSLRMQMMYPTALALAGKYNEAHKRLDIIEKQYPEQKKEILFKRALFYDREGQWEKLYETLKEYSNIAGQPRLAVSIMQINALMHLDLGVYALIVARKAMETFPGAPEINRAAAAIWAALGDPEEALFILEKTDDYLKLPITVQLLRNTQRHTEADFMQRMPNYNSRADNNKIQASLLPRAELAISSQWPPTLTKEEMIQESKRHAEKASQAFSPFIRKLSSLTADWYRYQGDEKHSDTDKWIAAARDNMERAMALNELASLMIRNERQDNAAVIIEEVLELVPDSGILWRVLISLSNGQWDIIQKARKICPTDPEIWLAYIVAKTREDGPNDWSLTEMKNVINEKSFSVGTIIRAADFMMRHEMINSASEAVPYITQNCRGLLPGYILGIRCGLLVHDEKSALLCARKAAENALDPWPFFRLIAEIETTMLSIDEETVRIVDKMRTQFPEEQRWTTRLSEIYLRRNEPKNAFDILERLIASQPGNADLNVMLLTAEAARRSGKMEKSIKILETAYSMYPSSRIVLNNLVYTLSLDKTTLPRAIELLPKLLEIWGDSLAALDTAAVVYLNSQKTDKANDCLRRALELAETTDPTWLQLNPSVVDMDVYLGEYDNYTSENNMSELQRTERILYREEVFPIAKELSRQIRTRANIRNSVPAK